MNENKLNNKLTRVDEAIATMRKRLNLDETESIENVASRTDLSSIANIFLQSNEPEKKDGIWLQTDEYEKKYDKLIIDNNVILPYKWNLDKQSETLICYDDKGAIEGFTSRDMRRNSFLILNGYLWAVSNDTYSLGATQACTFLIKYDLNGNHVAQYKIGNHQWAGSQIVTNKKNKIFICNNNLSSYTITVFDVEQETFVNNIGISYSRPEGYCYADIDNSIYYAGNGKIYCLNTETYENKQIFTLSNASALFVIGNYLIVSNSTERKVYNIVNNYVEEKELSTLLTAELPAIVGSSSNIFEIDNYVYIYNGSLLSVYRLDKTTFEVESIDLSEENLSVWTIMYYNTIIYGVMIDGSSFRLIPMNTQSKAYENNSIILTQSPIDKTLYQTQLYNYSGLQGRLLYSFYGVYYYNTEKGLLILPVYCGNGTEWIKIKN